MEHTQYKWVQITIYTEKNFLFQIIVLIFLDCKIILIKSLWGTEIDNLVGNISGN
jgi:hypothetical protein